MIFFRSRVLKKELKDKNSQISDLKKFIAEDKLELKKMQESLNNIDDGIIIAGNDNKIIFSNYSVGKFFNIKFGGLPPELQRISAEVLSSKKEKKEQLTSFLSPKNKKYLLVTAKHLHINESEPYVLLIIHDITESTIVEQTRKDFTSNASHELKTPVANIMLIAESIKNFARKDFELLDDFINKLLNEAKRLSNLVSDLLDLSRLEKPLRELSKVNIASVTSECVDDLREKAKEKQINLSVKVNKDNSFVLGDKGLLKTAINNLIENAIVYTSSGGKVDVFATKDGKKVVVSVKDTGIGIPSRHQKRIFERFYRVDSARSRTSGSTGLGLAIVKNIIEIHKGKVKVKSELNKGSEFSIILPLV